MIGKFFYVNECIFKKVRIFFVRIFIEVDIIKDISENMEVKDSIGWSFFQQVVFEWKSKYYKKCLKVGYNCVIFVEVDKKVDNRGVRDNGK